jgi:serine/threonine protein kinase
MAATHRHQQDFEIIDFLGSGAFGEVYKVRNRLDGRLAALKKIRIDGRRRERILREAVLLSSLSHQRITRYYNCWIEQFEEPIDDGDGDETGANGTTKGGAGGRRAGAGVGTRGGGSAKVPGLHSDSIFARTGEVFSTYGDASAVDNDESSIAPSAVASVASPVTAAAPAPAPVAPEASLVCNICSRMYQDWEVRTDEWTLLNASLRPLSLCIDCYKSALTKLGLDLSRVTISIRTDNGSDAPSSVTAGGAHSLSGTGNALGSPRPPAKKTVTVNMLFIQTELCDRTLLEECLAMADMDRERTTHAASGGPSAASAASASASAPNPASNAATTSTSTGTTAVPFIPLSSAAQSRMWQLFWEIVEGLAYLHSCGVIHRDLKGSNVLTVGPVGAATVKIGDLGLATTIAPDTPATGTGAAAAAASLAGTHHGSYFGGSATAAATGGTAGSGVLSPSAAVTSPGGDALLGGLQSVAEADDSASETDEDDNDDEGEDEEDEAGAGGGGGGSPHLRVKAQNRRKGHRHQRRTTGNGGATGTDRRNGGRLNGSPTLLPGGGRGRAGTGGTATGTFATELSRDASQRMSRGVGTFFYMSPEALEGTYSDKSDMYSLGVVCYEMWSCFKSSSERARLLEALKQGSVPRSFMEHYSAQTQLISNLMQADASRRPAAAELLRYRYFIYRSPSTPLAQRTHAQALSLAGGIGGGVSGPGASAAALGSTDPPIDAAAIISALVNTDIGGSNANNGVGAAELPWQIAEADPSTLRALLLQALLTIKEQALVINQLRHERKG